MPQPGLRGRQLEPRTAAARLVDSISLLWVGAALSITPWNATALEVTCPDLSTVQIHCVEGGNSIPCGEETTSIVSYLAVPAGPAPFPGVIYNHGGFGETVGGDLIENAGQLACEGYIAYAKRRIGTSVPDTLLEVEQGLSEFENLAGAQLDDARLGMIGYSRGGLLVLRMAETHPGKFAAAIMLAPAPGGTQGWGSGNTAMDNFLLDVTDIDPGTAFLIQVASNDRPPDNPADDLVDLATTVHNSISPIVTTATLDVRDPWPSVLQGGHDLFQGEPLGQALSTDAGHYWREVIVHLDTHVAATMELPALRGPTLALGISLLLLAGLVVRADSQPHRSSDHRPWPAHGKAASGSSGRLRSTPWRFIHFGQPPTNTSRLTNGDMPRVEFRS